MTKKVEDIRNIAIVGHGSAGKTTLVDHLLVRTGALNGRHSVDDGTSICDFDEEEKHHKHSVEATLTHFEHSGKHFHVIDCPGYPDLIGQTLGSLQAVENAVIAIDAHAGIKVNTRRVWQEATDAGIGKLIVITKMDADNINFEQLLDDIREVFGNECIPVNVPLGVGADFRGVVSTLDVPGDVDFSDAPVDPREINGPLIESIVETDVQAMERYFDGVLPGPEERAGLIREAIAESTLVPILCLSTQTGAGVDEFLNFVARTALSPVSVSRHGLKEGVDVNATPDPSGPLAAQVFRTRIDPFVQKLSFVRVFSGTLKKDDTVAATGARKGVKVSQLLSVQASETESIGEAGPGEIVAIAKSDDLHTGSCLGDVEMPEIPFPKPMVGLAVAPKSRGDETKLSSALHKLIEEDSTIHLDHDPETKEMVLTGMSDLHLALVQERLKRRDKVEVDTKEPKIPYRETIQAEAAGSYRHKKQSGGSGQFAEVHIRMFPFPEGTDPEEYAVKARFPHLKHVHYHPESNFLWVDTVVGGAIPGNFMPAIEKGFLERIKKGVIANCSVQNVCVEVHYGKDHPVDSNETAFRMAANRAFIEVFKNAKPTLLEPIVRMHITVPASNVGDVSSDLSGRRGQMIGMDSAGGGQTTVEAKAPLAEVTTYARTLSSMSGGQGSYSMEFSHYDVVPANVQQEIMAGAAKESDEEH